MRLVLLGGAPGVGKTSVGRALLRRAMAGDHLVQWVDVDALWLHQPWRVDDRTKTMVQQNLAAVMANARTAGVDTLVVTWVFQSEDMQRLVEGLAPDGVAVVRVQLVADEATWRARFEADPERPPIDGFLLDRYATSQATPADHRIDVSTMGPDAAADAVVEVLGLPAGA